MDDVQEQSEFTELVLLALQGQIDQPRMEQLEAILRTDPERVRDYVELMELYTELSPLGSVDYGTINEGGEASDVWMYLLAEEEQTAPPIDLSQKQRGAPAKPTLKASGTHYRKPITNRDRLLFVARFAAIVMISVSVVLLDRWFQRVTNSPKPTLAYLEDKIEAQWDKNYDLPREDGQMIQGYYGLMNGYTKISFANGAEVVIEGPATWTLNAKDNMHLYKGRAYARVPEDAIGFSINTDDAKIIDLGTEFGVYVNEMRNVELHVIKGETLLITGREGLSKNTHEVTGGQARYVDSKLNRINTISYNPEAFARAINSRSQTVWHGQTGIDLADIVGGGNGLGTGRREIGINPLSGKRGPYESRDRDGEGRYVPLPMDRYIDGIFVPWGGPEQVVSTEGHVFKDCPVTNHIFYTDLITGTGKHIWDYHDRPPRQRLGGRTYGTADYPALFMHSNLGITFDLDTIRADLPFGTISHFRADAGFSSDMPREGNAVVWVLLDGQEAFTAQLKEPEKTVAVDVPLPDSARFLTLMTTDGGDVDRPEVEFGRSTDSDWCVFGRPELVLSEP